MVIRMDSMVWKIRLGITSQNSKFRGFQAWKPISICSPRELVQSRRPGDFGPSFHMGSVKLPRPRWDAFDSFGRRADSWQLRSRNSTSTANLHVALRAAFLRRANPIRPRPAPNNETVKGSGTLVVPPPPPPPGAAATSRLSWSGAPFTPSTNCSSKSKPSPQFQ